MTEARAEHLTEAEKVELRRKAEAATPGDWRYDASENMIYAGTAGNGIRVLECKPRSLDVPIEVRDANGEFVAGASPTAVLSLLNELEGANETYTDLEGTVWTRPTAEAYARVCGVKDMYKIVAAAKEKAEAERDQLRGQITAANAALQNCLSNDGDWLSHPNAAYGEFIVTFNRMAAMSEAISTPIPAATGEVSDDERYAALKAIRPKQVSP